MAARVIEVVVERNGVSGDALDDVVFGCTNAAGEDNRNVARMGSLLAGLPVEVPGATVNRLGASGLEAVRQAAHAVQSGEGELLLAGGVESMSRSPFVMLKPERGFPRGNMPLVDTTIGWRFVNPRMEERYSTESMGETAENVAERYGVSREDQDAFDLVELNEAFAAQVLASMRELGIPHEKLNVNGGAIALGHPLGQSGARLLGTLIWELRRRGGRYGLATMCIGVGQGLAMIVENPTAARRP